MIPFYRPPSWSLGPFTLEVFGIFVMLGVLIGARFASKDAERRGLDRNLMADFAFWGLIGGVIGGHLVHLFFYHPEELEAGGLIKLLKVWDGLSSTGGLLGGVITALIFFRQKKVKFHTYADPLAIGTSIGWAVSRLGCFAVHDHPGRVTDFFLGVKFPANVLGAGVPAATRHDLGLYDALALFAMFGILYTLRNHAKMTGRLLPLLALMYGVCRFLFDFLRAMPGDLGYVDARYLGLTPAQYVCFAMVAYGLWGLFVHKVEAAPPVVPAKQKRAAKG